MFSKYLVSLWLTWACLGGGGPLASARTVSDLDDAGRPRRVAIFSASYGGGHDASARAIRDELLRTYPNLEIQIFYGQDYHPIVGGWPGVGKLSTYLFNTVYQVAPEKYDRIFEAAMATAEKRSSAGQIPNPLFSTRKIQADIERFQPDVIYSTYHILTSKLIKLREKGLLNPAIPIAWLDTDFVQRKFFFLHSLGVDLTFIAHRVVLEERLKLGIPAEKMALTGLFINNFASAPFSEQQRRDFLKHAMSIPDQQNGRPEIWINGRMQDVNAAEINLDPDVMTVTIASGRSGAGDYPVIIKGLLRQARLREQKIQIVAVCGDNQKNYAAVTRAYGELTKKERADLKLVVSHLVDNGKLLKLVRSSRLFIGKSGSQSPFEASVMGVVRVLIDIIGGQERWTANLFRRVGLAEVVPAHEQHLLAERAFAYMEDPDRMARMRAADQDVRESYDPAPITRFFEDAISSRTGKPSVVPARSFASGSAMDRMRNYCQSILRRIKD